MHVTWTFTGDGLLALAGGTLAFLAVMIQTRSASRGLQKQLDTEKQARRDEQTRQEQAVAKALLYEIDDFYKHYIGGPPKYFEALDPSVAPLVPLKIIGPKTFVLYAATASKLGCLDDGVVEKVIRFYDAAESYQSRMLVYAKSYERMQVASRDGRDAEQKENEETARQVLKRLR